MNGNLNTINLTNIFIVKAKLGLDNSYMRKTSTYRGKEYLAIQNRAILSSGEPS